MGLLFWMRLLFSLTLCDAVWSGSSWAASGQNLTITEYLHLFLKKSEALQRAVHEFGRENREKIADSKDRNRSSHSDRG